MRLNVNVAYRHLRWPRDGQLLYLGTEKSKIVVNGIFFLLSRSAADLHRWVNQFPHHGLEEVWKLIWG